MLKVTINNSRHKEVDKSKTMKQPRIRDDQQTLDEWKNSYVVIAENRSVIDYLECHCYF